MPIIAPSLLAANFLKIQDAVSMVNESDAAWLHLDVMDGVFVPNISFGLPIIEAIKPVCKKIMDVHLMIVEPEKYIEDFKKVGADVLTIHLEACNHLHRNVQHIKSLGMKAGVALNPHTSISLLLPILQEVDVVCLMSVNPGFGGQKFIPHTIQKIKELKQHIIQNKLSTLIEIDGGVTLDNAKEIYEAGADVLVAGNTVFKSSNPLQTIQTLKNI